MGKNHGRNKQGTTIAKWDRVMARLGNELKRIAEEEKKEKEEKERLRKEKKNGKRMANKN